MKNAVVILMVTLTLLGCSRSGGSDEQSPKADFTATTDVYLEIIRDYGTPNKTEFRILKHDKDGELLYSLKTGTNFSKVIRVGDVAYLSVFDPEQDDGNLSLLEIDLSEGRVRNTDIRLSEDFEITSDGVWICYAFNAHEVISEVYPDIKAYFPIIYLERLRGGSEKYEYDKLSEVPVNAALAVIEREDGVFRVSYFQEGPIPIRVGEIVVATHEFRWIK
jgi:hypothetical protein